MQPFDHPPFDGNDALALMFRQREGFDHLARPLYLLIGGREDLIAGLDLRGMDQRLAVHAKRAALLAFGPEPCVILEVIIDAIDHIEAEAPRREHAHGQPGYDGETVAQSAGPRFL